MLLIGAVKPRRIECQILADAIVKDSKAPTNYCGRSLARIDGAGRPCKTDARREIKIAFDVGLIFVSQSEVDGEIRPQLPVILDKSAKIELADCRERITCRDRKLSSATALGANLSRRESVLQTEQSNLVILDTCDHGLTGNSATRESPCAAEVLRRVTGNVNVAQSRSELHRVQAQGERSSVSQFPSILNIRSQTDLRAAAGECVRHLDRRNRVVRVVAGGLMNELKARLVNRLLIENRRLSQSYIVLRTGGVV